MQEYRLQLMKKRKCRRDTKYTSLDRSADNEASADWVEEAMDVINTESYDD
jgi:hypothetical protein